MLLLIQDRLHCQKNKFLLKKNTEIAVEKFGNKFKAGMGAEAVKELLTEIDLERASQRN